MHSEDTPPVFQLPMFSGVRTCSGPGCAVWVFGKAKYCGRACYHRSWIGRKKANRTGKTFACEACGEPFYRYQADITKAAKNGSTIRFCSKACDNGRKSATNVERECPQCGSCFVAWASRVRSANELGQQIFCSAKCRDRHGGEARRNAVTIPCFACGTMHTRVPALVRERNFCSRACMATEVANWSKGSGGYGNYGHREDIGHFVRSAWEANFSRLLRLLGIPYEFEPRTFRLPDGKAYRPDSHVAGMLWVEVKGQMTEAAASKIALFRTTYPAETLVVLGEADYWLLEDTFAPLIPEWEIPWTRSRPQRAKTVPC